MELNEVVALSRQGKILHTWSAQDVYDADYRAVNAGEKGEGVRMRTAMVSAVKLLTEKSRSLTPLHNWVVIERVTEEYKTASGIVLATTDGNESGTEEAEVIAVGPACTSGLQVGDRCKFVGKAIGFQTDGKHYYMVCDAPPSELKTDVHGNPIGAPYVICVIRREETLQ